MGVSLCFCLPLWLKLSAPTYNWWVYLGYVGVWPWPAFVAQRKVRVQAFGGRPRRFSAIHPHEFGSSHEQKGGENLQEINCHLQKSIYLFRIWPNDKNIKNHPCGWNGVPSRVNCGTCDNMLKQCKMQGLKQWFEVTVSRIPLKFNMVRLVRLVRPLRISVGKTFVFRFHVKFRGSIQKKQFDEKGIEFSTFIYIYPLIEWLKLNQADWFLALVPISHPPFCMGCVSFRECG